MLIGFVFYTNFESQKGQEILGTMKAALVFHWKSLRRQVRVRGIVEEVSKAEADDYFATRPRESQIGAWASRQSATLASRDLLEAGVKEVEARFAGRPVPRRLRQQSRRKLQRAPARRTEGPPYSHPLRLPDFRRGIRARSPRDCGQRGVDRDALAPSVLAVKWATVVSLATTTIGWSDRKSTRLNSSH